MISQPARQCIRGTVELSAEDAIRLNSIAAWQ